MNPFLTKLKLALGRLSQVQRIQLVLALVATLGLIWGFTVFANRVRYGVLFSNIPSDDAASVMAALKDKQVPYRVAAGGTVIEVPFGRIDELRLELAGDGLLPGGGVGFEIFDKPAFGLSDFVQNVNYQRALERELARTIQSLESVESVRVHLALPPETIFADEQRQASASVVLKLRSGRSLAAERVRAMTHLVASGVEGLEPTQVNVIDGEGRLLSSPQEEEGMMTASAYEAKRGLEHDIEHTLVGLLEPIVGRGRVRARAAVELNLVRQEKREELFDPDVAVVRSEERRKSKSRGPASGPGGVPGTASNLPGGTGATGEVAGQQDTQETLTNYELNHTVSTTSESAGKMLRQSVAVVIDHARTETTDDAGAAAATPRPAEEMQKITELVRAAIGYDARRGDVLTVENIPFDRLDGDEPAGGVDLLSLVVKVSRFASLPLAVLLFALFVIRPGITALRSVAQPAGAGDLPPTVAELQAQVQAQLSSGQPRAMLPGSNLRQKLIEAIAEDPQTAALVVRGWLSNRRSGATSARKS